MREPKREPNMESLLKTIARLKKEKKESAAILAKFGQDVIMFDQKLRDLQQENAAHIAENHRLGLLLTQRLFKRVLFAIRFPKMTQIDLDSEFNSITRYTSKTSERIS